MKFLPFALLSLGSAFVPDGTLAIAAVSTADQAAEIAALEKKLGAARDEVTALKTALAVAKAQTQAAESRAQIVNRPEPELDSLRGQVRVLERDLQSATAALKRVVAEKAATDSSLEAAKQQLAETARDGPAQRESQAATAVASSASMNQKIAELQSALDDTRAQLSESERNFEARGRELESLRAALAAAQSKPAIAAGETAALRRTLGETEEQLAAVTEELADSRRELTTTREVSRLRQLEAEKSAYLNQRDDSGVSKDELARLAASRADAEQRLAAANAARAMLERELDELRGQAAKARAYEARIRELESGKSGAPPQTGAGVSSEEFARVAAAQVDAERKLATALRSYTLLTKERDELRARVAELSARLSTAPEQR